MATALLLLQVAKLPIFRADRRFVGGVSNSNYVANGAPAERCRPTFAKVSHPGLPLRAPGFATTSKLPVDPVFARSSPSYRKPRTSSLIFKLSIYEGPYIRFTIPGKSRLRRAICRIISPRSGGIGSRVGHDPPATCAIAVALFKIVIIFCLI